MSLCEGWEQGPMQPGLAFAEWQVVRSPGGEPRGCSCRFAACAARAGARSLSPAVLRRRASQPRGLRVGLVRSGEPPSPWPGVAAAGSACWRPGNGRPALARGWRPGPDGGGCLAETPPAPLGILAPIVGVPICGPSAHGGVGMAANPFAPLGLVVPMEGVPIDALSELCTSAGACPHA